MSTEESHRRYRKRFRRRRGLGCCPLPPPRRGDPKTIKELQKLTVAKVKQLPVSLDVLTSGKGKLNRMSVFMVLFYRVISEMKFRHLTRLGLGTHDSRRRYFNTLYGNLSCKIKEALSDYATDLNQLKVPGVVKCIPASISKFPGHLSEQLKMDTTDEWTHFVKISRNSLINGYRVPKKPSEDRSFKFTPHRQEFRKDTIYRHRIVISKNVSRFIFGEKYERIAKYVVHESRSTIVINIASSELLNSIFSLEKLSAFGFWRGDVAYHGCGKVHLEYCD